MGTLLCVGVCDECVCATLACPSLILSTQTNSQNLDKDFKVISQI